MGFSLRKCRGGWVVQSYRFWGRERKREGEWVGLVRGTLDESDKEDGPREGNKDREGWAINSDNPTLT